VAVAFPCTRDVSCDYSLRTEADEKEVCRCPLCNTWFRDIRLMPEFESRYQEFDHAFDSQASSSILLTSEDGNDVGDERPPWIFHPLLSDSSSAILEAEGGYVREIAARPAKIQPDDPNLGLDEKGGDVTDEAENDDSEGDIPESSQIVERRTRSNYSLMPRFVEEEAAVPKKKR